LKSLHEAWQALKRRWKEVARTQYEEERNKLRDKAWRGVEALKEKYDGRFEELKKRIEAYFQAHKPLKHYEVRFNFHEFIGGEIYEAHDST